MRHKLLGIAGVLLLLAGCSGQSLGFQNLYQLAVAGNVDSQIELAHAYADPARFPGRAPSAPDLAQAVKWCTIAKSRRAEVAEPACRDVLAAASQQEKYQGWQLAQEWLTAPQNMRHP